MLVAQRKITPAFRARLSEKLMDLGNFILVALTIGQLVTGNGFSTAVFVTGIVLWISCYIISYLVGT